MKASVFWGPCSLLHVSIVQDSNFALGRVYLERCGPPLLDVFASGSDSMLMLVQVKLIDFGAAVDMCTGINFNPQTGMLDPRYRCAQHPQCACLLLQPGFQASTKFQDLCSVQADVKAEM